MEFNRVTDIKQYFKSNEIFYNIHIEVTKHNFPKKRFRIIYVQFDKRKWIYPFNAVPFIRLITNAFATSLVKIKCKFKYVKLMKSWCCCSFFLSAHPFYLNPC